MKNKNQKSLNEMKISCCCTATYRLPHIRTKKKEKENNLNGENSLREERA